MGLFFYDLVIKINVKLLYRARETQDDDEYCSFLREEIDSSMKMWMIVEDRQKSELRQLISKIIDRKEGLDIGQLDDLVKESAIKRLAEEGWSENTLSVIKNLKFHNLILYASNAKL